ncbi:MAG: tetratricopeptide repeat protein [bacterium]|nr:tetratricopeptide repeat protein [bacterium]
MNSNDSGTRAPKSARNSRFIYGVLAVVLVLGGAQLYSMQLAGREAARARLEREDRANGYTRDRRGCEGVAGESGQEMVELLLKGDFEQASTRLGRLQELVEADLQCDRLYEPTLDQVGARVYALPEKREDLVAALDQWSETDGDSHIPFMLRGWVRVNLGYIARGNGSAPQTSQAQWDAMGEHFALATEDFARTRELEPRALGAYLGQLTMLRSDSDKTPAAQVLNDALAVDLPTQQLFLYYLKAVEPRWGGEQKDRDLAVERARPFMARNPAVRVVLGHPYQLQAKAAYRREAYEEAATLWNKALRHADQREWHYELGRALRQTRNCGRGIEHFTMAIEDDPEYGAAWGFRGKCYMAIGKVDEGLADFERSVALRPNMTWGIKDRAWAYDRKGRYEDAVADLYRVIELDREPTSWTLKQLGEILYYDLERYGEAKQAYKLLTEHYPGEAFGWYRYGMSLHRLREPSATQALEHYLSIVDLADEGAKANIAEVRQVLGLTGESEEETRRALPGLAAATEVRS